MHAYLKERDGKKQFVHAVAINCLVISYNFVDTSKPSGAQIFPPVPIWTVHATRLTEIKQQVLLLKPKQS